MGIEVVMGSPLLSVFVSTFNLVRMGYLQPSPSVHHLARIAIDLASAHPSFLHLDIVAGEYPVLCPDHARPVRVS